MNLYVRHTLQYSYSNAVALEPQTLYLYPKSYPHQMLLEYDLQIDPLPSKVVRNVDAEGNVQQMAYFSDNRVHQLSVVATMVVSSKPFNVFDFVHYPFNTKNLSFLYEDRIYKYLAPYLSRMDVTDAVAAFANQVAQDAQWRTVPFLVNLSKYIHQNFVYSQRTFGDALPPHYTLLQQAGSCRDFARLYIACCRSMGIAARFVSGYLYGNPMQAHELHAWVEVFLPGAGWRGFDPTEGKAMVNNHICMGASADYDQLAPVMGSFKGVTDSSLYTYVDIRLQQ
ncbi:transglutaminase-like putative cysteine protease [Dyadobacter jejuensis]|uniref:Transglutaminase-like putative cysteine protease n=1 Tax=Dyadobacter jejuensis TaxID=1082580 RepID=A0A316ARQ8_9BACT|nr:transglutaminase family protein [Dyadobacter jejuensis]PWJ60282.1 transglutaminase-like putative cysteine protease [Dyadobacter jejuensis]